MASLLKIINPHPHGQITVTILSYRKKTPQDLCPEGFLRKYGVGRLKKHFSVFFALSHHSFAVFDHLKFCV